MTFQQKRPDLNLRIFNDLTSGVSMRKSAINHRCSYLTIYRKFLWLAQIAKSHHEQQSLGAIKELQFDEMESLEHTKLKPLTIALAVSDDYRILGVQVGTIPAKGALSALAQQKYGYRENQSSQKILELLTSLKTKELSHTVLLKSDAKITYRELVKKVFPKNPYEQYVCRGQKEKRREMKHQSQEKKIFDPLFALNQRCAKLRDHIKRLTRRSWCTSKLKEHLEAHLYLYIAYNNKYQLI